MDPAIREQIRAKVKEYKERKQKSGHLYKLYETVHSVWFDVNVGFPRLVPFIFGSLVWLVPSSFFIGYLGVSGKYAEGCEGFCFGLGIVVYWRMVKKNMALREFVREYVRGEQEQDSK